jgi:hypothetical protein
LAQYELVKIPGEYEVNKAELNCLISGTDSVWFFGSSKNQMVTPQRMDISIMVKRILE